MNFIYIENYFRFLFNLKTNIILIIFYLPELSIKYNIDMKVKDINNIFKLE